MTGDLGPVRTTSEIGLASGAETKSTDYKRFEDTVALNATLRPMLP